MSAPVVAVVGSSVAQCISGEGWVRHLASALGDEARVVNLAQSGLSTRLALHHLVPRLVPDTRLVLVSLSLPNEGLMLKEFEAGILKLSQAIRRKCPDAKIALCGPYPCNECRHSPHVRAMFDDLVQWFQNLPTETADLFIDFFSSVHNGQGGWRDGEFEDSVHPNAEGQKRMFDAIDLGAVRALLATTK